MFWQLYTTMDKIKMPFLNLKRVFFKFWPGADRNCIIFTESKELQDKTDRQEPIHGQEHSIQLVQGFDGVCHYVPNYGCPPCILCDNNTV
jgi:hypothetical protein